MLAVEVREELLEQGFGLGLSVFRGRLHHVRQRELSRAADKAILVRSKDGPKVPLVRNGPGRAAAKTPAKVIDFRTGCVLVRNEVGGFLVDRWRISILVRQRHAAYRGEQSSGFGVVGALAATSEERRRGVLRRRPLSPPTPAERRAA